MTAITRRESTQARETKAEPRPAGKGAVKLFRAHMQALGSERRIRRDSLSEQKSQARIEENSDAGAGGLEGRQTPAQAVTPPCPAASSRPSLPPELVQKMVESVRIGQKRCGTTEMEIELKATMFDRMKVLTSTSDGQVRVRMIVKQITVRDRLEGNIDELYDQLEAQGLSVEDIAIELED